MSKYNGLISREDLGRRLDELDQQMINAIRERAKDLNQVELLSNRDIIGRRYLRSQAEKKFNKSYSTIVSESLLISEALTWIRCGKCGRVIGKIERPMEIKETIERLKHFIAIDK